MVIILDGWSEHGAHVWRKMTKKIFSSSNFHYKLGQDFFDIQQVSN